MKQRILNNKYAIHSVIGKGGMAIVYKGENIKTKEIIAIKMLKEEYLDNREFVSLFEKEAEIAKVVRHKNMVNTYDVDTDNGTPYLVMEYVQGRTLKEYIKMKGVLPEDEAVDIAIQVCDAMIYAHKQKLIHRDIKSQNILINKEGQVKVGDFGIAKMTTQATMTMGGSNVIGSVHYMSPEQAMGNVVDHTTDIYSLGIVMYEMMTGTLPFKGDTPVAIALKHVNDGLPSPMTKNHNLSAALDKIIMKASNKHKDLRYQSASELKEDLLASKEDPSGSFVAVADDEGDTKTLPIIKKELLEKYAQQKAEETKSKEKDSVKETTDIGLYENERLRQVQAETERNGAAAARARKIVSAILFSIIFIIGALIVILALVNDKAEKEEYTQKLEVPDVEKLLVDEAAKIIKVNGFDYTIEYAVNDEYAEGVVISQTPKGGQMVDSSVLIKLSVSSGPEMFAVPDIVNIPFSEAIDQIKDAGFLVGEVYREVSELPSEYIVRQDPKAGTDIPADETINIWIAVKDDEGLPVVPNLVGRQLDEAEYLLSSYNIGTENIEIIEIDSGFAENMVVYQEPDSGMETAEGQQMILYVSNGLELAYSTEKQVFLSLINETTKVRIVYVDGETKQVVYDKSLTKGDHEIPLTFYTNIAGEKNIIIYYDGQEKQQDIVTFEVSE